MKNVVYEILGKSANIKILEYLSDTPGYDVTISDIAQGAGLSRQHVYRVLDKLVYHKIVKATRTAGGTQMFALDDESDISQDIVQLNGHIIKYWQKRNKLK